MPDTTPNAGQLLAGPSPNTGDMPLYSRPGQPQAPQPQAPQQQPEPTPQQADAARHHAIESKGQVPA